MEKNKQNQLENAIEKDDQMNENLVDSLVVDEQSMPSYAYDSDATEADAMPSANVMARDTSNNKRLKIAAGIFGGIVIALIGVGFTINNYQASKEAENQAKAAEEANKQKMTSDVIQFDLTPPADAVPTDEVTQNETLTPEQQALLAQAQQNNQVESSTPVAYETTPAPPSIPEMPTFNTYTEKPTPKYEDLVPPSYQSAPQQPMIVETEEDEKPQSTVTVSQPQHSHVLVDVKGSGSSNTSSDNPRAVQAKNVTYTSNRNMLLVRGTTIPCTLITKIDSTYKGFTTCQITKDVYSANGKTLLIERGSRVFGEQNVEMQQGKARVSVIWSKVETPKGISISLESPSTGGLGEMGIGASVNNHFWTRFGGAIMLSVIQDGLAVASSHLEKQNENGNTTNINNTTNTAGSMAEEILKNTINIPPTARVNQGSLINIMVAKDIDFEGIYSLKNR